jgi:predicted nucleotidyltransferase
MINSDFSDLLRALNDANAKYLIVGGIALAFHDRPRFTKDLDLFIDRSPENAARVYRALAHFGAPLHTLTVEDLQSPELVYQIGVDPVRVDILTDIDGVAFSDAWDHRLSESYGDIPVNVIALDDLIKNKLATGRSQDIADIERLQNS